MIFPMHGKPEAVRSMFAGIAPRYDLLNHLLSFNLDRRWRSAAVRAVAPRPGEMALDVCAGTGDLALLLARTGARVTALDFCRPMLVRGRNKTAAAGLPVGWIEADALSLPFVPGSFDVVTAAFGVRNLDNPEKGLEALAAMLRPGGRLAVLEFARPRQRLFRAVYYAYFHRLLPRIGAAISGDGNAYRYLPESVMAFLEPEEMARVLEASGLSEVRTRRLGLGAVTLVTAHRPS